MLTSLHFRFISCQLLSVRYATLLSYMWTNRVYFSNSSCFLNFSRFIIRLYSNLSDLYLDTSHDYVLKLKLFLNIFTCIFLAVCFLLSLMVFIGFQEYICKFEKPNTSPNSLEPSTTVLSPYLRFGCLSSRLFYHKIKQVYFSPFIHILFLVLRFFQEWGNISVIGGAKVKFQMLPLSSIASSASSTYKFVMHQHVPSVNSSFKNITLFLFLHIFKSNIIQKGNKLFLN